MSERKPKPARGTAFGILNPWGDLWTYETFRTREAAARYVASFWAGNPSAPDLSKFKVVPVRVTVSVLRQRPGNASQDSIGRLVTTNSPKPHEDRADG